MRQDFGGEGLARRREDDVRRILARIGALADDPRGPGCEKLAGPDELYRVRQGVYRIVYTIHDDRVVVEVIRVGYRGEVYRGRG